MNLSLPTFEARCLSAIRSPLVSYGDVRVVVYPHHLPNAPVKGAVLKWQGYPPENLKVVGKLLPPLPEVSLPRFTGKAEYASRVWFPDMLYARFLTCPHPHARIRTLDTSAAEKMPGVAYILTYKNAPQPSAALLKNPPTGNRFFPYAFRTRQVGGC